MNDILFYIIIFIIPALAQLSVTVNYNTYLTKKYKKGLTGFEVARKILDSHGLEQIHIVEVRGNLSDHYDPNRKVIRLSHNVFHGDSVSSISIAAHECGHAIQDKDNYTFMKIRSLIFPIINIATNVSYILILIGLFTSVFNVIELGIIIIGLGLIFQLVTLPVEFNASKRAKEELNKIGVDSDEEYGITKVLRAAALTYVAGVLTSVMNLMYLLNRD